MTINLTGMFADVVSSAIPPALVYLTSSLGYVTSSTTTTAKTPATQRIGNEVVRSRSGAAKNYEQTDAVGGVRLGTVTMFENGEPAEQLNMKVFDGFRTGKNIETFRQFGGSTNVRPMIRVNSEGLFEKAGDDKINHFAAFNNFGMGLHYKTVDENYKLIPFNDFSKIIPTALIGKQSVFAYPFVHNGVENFKQFTDPSHPGNDGAIDVFEVRSSIANLSHSDVRLYGCRGDYQGGEPESNRKGSTQIDSKYELKTTSNSLFFDSQETEFGRFSFSKIGVSGSSGFKFPLPGFIDDSKYVSAPFDDGVDHLGEKYNPMFTTFNDFVLKRSNLKVTTVYNLNTLWTSKSGLLYDKGSSLVAWYRLNFAQSDANRVQQSATAGPNLELTSGFASTYPGFDTTTGASPGSLITNNSTGTSLFERNEKNRISDDDAFSFGNSTADSPFSFGGWVKVQSETQDQFSHNANIIVSKYSSGTDREWMLEVLDNSGAPSFRISLFDQNVGSVVATTANGSLSMDEWIHVIVTYNGTPGSHGAPSSTGIKIYLNATKIPIDVLNVNSYTAMHNTSARVVIGNNGLSHSTNTFLGNIAEICIWNTELSGENIGAIYNGGLNGFRQYGAMDAFLSSSRNRISEIGTRFKSTTCGLIYGESNAFGTDSIAFGGLKK